MRKCFQYKIWVILCLIGLFSFRDKEQNLRDAKQPRLIVGIVVDQMRYDLLDRFMPKFGKGGFRRLVDEGTRYTNVRFNYVPTYTGPGHASIYTGTTPSVHGIVANYWYDKISKKGIGCTNDSTVNPIGTTNKLTACQSPQYLKSETMLDALLSQNKNSKAVSIALKDRGAVLPAGKLKQKNKSAYWFEGTIGNWVTSSFYKDSLPRWVQKFNEKKLPATYLSQVWSPLNPSKEIEDNQPWEEPLKGEKLPIFPHDLPAIKGSTFDLIKSTPFGNTLTKDLAIAAIEGEELGQDKNTDFLAISFSSTDYIGHSFGPGSLEIEDAYLRLDKDIEEFLSYLDSKIGKENIVLFLTADHGVAEPPASVYLNGKGPYLINADSVKNELSSYLKDSFGEEKLLLEYTNQQIYIDFELAFKLKIPVKTLEDGIVNCLNKNPKVGTAYSLIGYSSITQTLNNNWLPLMIFQGFSKERSGDIYFQLSEGNIEYATHGTQHGSAFEYDTHVPLLFWGNAKHQTHNENIEITKIAHMIANLGGFKF